MVPASLAMADDKGADLAVVVNKDTPLDNVDLATLAKIFKCEKVKASDSVRFAVAMRESGSPERAAALKQIYQMTDANYQKYFLQATFTGQVQAAPKKLGSVASLKQFVSNTPGAISYMRGSDLDDSVKVVKVDGKAPGEAGYGLKIN